MNGTSDSTGVQNHDRLSGWKEIAAYLGRSVRTAHRWEVEMGLPVHRIETPAGEVVWASRAEIETWLAANEKHPGPPDGHPEPGNGENGEVLPRPAASPSAAGDDALRPAIRVGRARALAAGLLLGAIFALGWAVRDLLGTRHDAGAPASTGRPAVWKVSGDQLLVFDEARHLLWTHRFDGPLNEASYARAGEGTERLVAIEDLDGDSRPEVLFVRSASGASAAARRLYCFESDGRLRFVHQPQRTVMYGEKGYDPPFGVVSLLVATGASGRRAIWIVAPHNLLFPTAVEKIGARGEVLGEYWNDGHLVTQLDEASLGGRRVVLAGGTNNELWGGTLLVLDQESPTGFTPADKLDYRCRNCPEGAPLAAFVFPRMEISRLAETRPYVSEIKVTQERQVIIRVTFGIDVPGQGARLAPVYYTLDDRLRIVAAETGDDYGKIHGTLELLGRVDHTFGPCDERELWPVLKWSAGKLQRLERLEANAIAVHQRVAGS